MSAGRYLLAWRLRTAQAALAWERVWPALWPVTALVMLFWTAACFDLLPELPGWLHAIVLVLFLGAFGFAFWRAWREIDLPDRSAARRRIELDSGLTHRPLAVLDDRMAGAADPFAEALWAAHRQRMAVSARNLRFGWPRGGLMERDPYALRAALSLVLLIGLVSAGGDVWSRLGRAFMPQLDRTASLGPPGVDLWITPPDYTGLPPIYLGSDPNQSGGTLAAIEPGKPVPVPAGSTVLVQVHGGRRTPQLALDDAHTDLAALDASDFNVTAKVGEAHHLAVTQGGSTLAAYDLQIVADLPPTAAWGDKPQVTARGALHLDYLAKDDYGVKSLSLEIRRPNSSDPPTVIALPVPSDPRKELKGATFQDLTPNPWAGLPVELRFIAHDAIDQIGISAPLKLILPEHKFRHPVARAIIDQRKLLTKDPNQSDAVAETLGDLASRPALFHDDALAFLALRSASDRLQLGAGRDDLAGIQKLLWDTALRIDEGDQPEAQKALREAERALQDALDRNAPDEEINRLMNEMRQAVNRYLQALMENAQKNGQQPQSDPNGNNQRLTQDDINRMLDQAQQMARSGAKDAAREALSQLQDMLENLRAGQSQPRQADGAAQQMMRNMQDLARKQQQLLDRSYRQAQRGQNGGQDQQGQSGRGQPQRQGGQNGQSGQSGTQSGNQAGEGGDLAGQQESLRRQLGQMMGKFGQDGQTPQALSRAERAMRDAVDALNRNAPGDAVGQQGEALDQLQQAAREMAEQMRQNGSGGQDGTAENGRDPFGRPLPGGQGDLDRGDVKIPEEADMQKSREILDELRRRASDRARPQTERDYIDRLLKRF
ncbi:MAG TPA: TIGR02302 family protein [Aliidongia sp.]|nr:TIGR02302 family protein [Aliidongia sp.]